MHTQVYLSCLEIQFKTLEAASLCSVAFQVNRRDSVYSNCRRLFNHAVNRFLFRAIFVLYVKWTTSSCFDIRRNLEKRRNFECILPLKIE